MIVFLDTMIYLHYNAVEEVAWTDLLASDRVVILVPRITRKELNKHKDRHELRQIRERAREILQMFNAWSERQPYRLRDGVDIEFYRKLPRVDFAEHDLDPGEADDVLAATILSFKADNPEADVMLVTQDIPATMMARDLGIAVTNLLEHLARPSAADPEEQEVRKLKRELEQIHAAAPKLRLRFVGVDRPDNVLRVTLPRPPHNTEEWIARQMEDIRAKYPPKNQAPTTTAVLLLGGISEAELARYNKHRERFFGEYEEHLRGSAQQSLRRMLTFEVHMELANDGGSTAHDVDVNLHFPDGFELLEAEDVEDAPEPPSPPRQPRTQTEVMADQLRSVSAIHSSMYSYPSIPDTGRMGEKPNLSSPDITKTGSYDVHWHARRIKHKQSEQLDPLAVSFRDYDDVKNFSIGFRLHAENMREVPEGNLHVVIEKQ